MDFFANLTTPTTDFTYRAWIFFIVQIVLLGAGAYLSFVHQDANAVRRSALQRLGNALLVLGGLGVLFSVLRLASVSLFMMPLWFRLSLIAEVLFAIFAVYYSQTTLPQQLAAAASASKRPLKRVAVPQQRLAAQNQVNGAVTPVELGVPRAEGIASGRRDSRRDRKRRNRS